MEIGNIKFPDLIPHVDTSFIDEMNKRNEEIFNSITPLDEVLAEQLKPILEGNRDVVNGLNDNYAKLSELYALKEKEFENSKADAQNVINGLTENYKKLNDLYSLKEKELENREKELKDSKSEAKKAKKYNTVMLIIAIASAGIALASFVATILIAVL